MSGGSFDYLYSRIDNEDPLDYWTLELLERMGNWLANPEQNQLEASVEIKRIHAELVKIKEQVFQIAQNNKFLNLLKEAEWWCSNDTGKDDLEKAWADYKAKENNPALEKEEPHG
jgi:hypothetical protein